MSLFTICIRSFHNSLYILVFDQGVTFLGAGRYTPLEWITCTSPDNYLLRLSLCTPVSGYCTIICNWEWMWLELSSREERGDLLPSEIKLIPAHLSLSPFHSQITVLVSNQRVPHHVIPSAVFWPWWLCEGCTVREVMLMGTGNRLVIVIASEDVPPLWYQKSWLQTVTMFIRCPQSAVGTVLISSTGCTLSGCIVKASHLFWVHYKWRYQ